MNPTNLPNDQVRSEPTLPSAIANATDRPPTGSRYVVEAFVLGIVALYSGVGIVICFVLQHNKVFETTGFAFLLGPYIIIMIAAVTLWTGRATRGALVPGMIIVLGCGIFIASARRGAWSGWGGLGLVPIIFFQYVVAGLSLLAAMVTRRMASTRCQSEPAENAKQKMSGINKVRIWTFGSLAMVLTAYSLLHSELQSIAQSIARRPYTGPGAPLPLPHSEYQKPEYLTPDHLNRNLLKNASFEKSMLDPWRNSPFQKQCDAPIFASDQKRSGSYSLKLRCDPSGSCSVGQDVTIKRDTWYLLSTWIKLEAQVPDEKTNGVGAGLTAISESFGISSPPPNFKTNEWQYVAHVFNSGKARQVLVSLNFGAPASGVVWYDDVALVELP